MEKQFDLICIGMALVDSIIKGFDPEPVSASGYRAESGSLNIGGEAVNEAMAAAKLGMKTGILCSLGEDAAGDMIADALVRQGVDTSRILRSAGCPTPVTTMFVNDDGTRKSITNGAHRHNFHPERYIDRFSDARGLIFGSLFRAPFDDPEIIHSVLTAAKAAGQIVFADTKLPNFRFLTLDDLHDSLPLIDYITPNEDEACHFSGKEQPEEMADTFLGYGVKNVIIKLGGKGCLFKNAEERMILPVRFRPSTRPEQETILSPVLRLRFCAAHLMMKLCALPMPAARSARRPSAREPHCKAGSRYCSFWGDKEGKK